MLTTDLDYDLPPRLIATEPAAPRDGAKLMIVDDLFLTVGSCNINDRGFEFEGEINVAIADAEFCREARLDLWREHLADDDRLSGDIDSAMNRFNGNGNGDDKNNGDN